MLTEKKSIKNGSIIGYIYNGVTYTIGSINAYKQQKEKQDENFKINETYEEILKAIENGEIEEDHTYLDRLKKQKIKELNDRAEKEIISGFTSNALGSEHLYQSEPTDQLNLIGIVQTAQLTNSNQLFKCSADNGKTWDYVEHTPEQLTKVLEDGKQRKQDILIKCAELKAKVLQAQTEDEVKAVVWD